MGSAPNELSDLDKTELVKCGEILASSNQKEFLFGCVQCNGVFSQMPTFARHLQWAHQSDELLGDEIKLKDMSVYTVEELLSYNDATTNVNGDVSTDVGIRKSNVDDDNDTGIDSDVELEKEIEELLTSMATADSSSGHDTEYSQSDSGVESRNYTDQYQNVSNELNDMHYKKGQKNDGDILVENIWKTSFGNKTNNLKASAYVLESEDFVCVEDDSSLFPEETISTAESLSNVGESTDDGIHTNYGESSTEKSSKVEENDQACEEELYYRMRDVKQSTGQDEETTCKGSNIKTVNSNEEGIFNTENVNKNENVKDKINTVINEHGSTVKQDENLLGLDNEERYEELDMLSNDEIECGRDISEDSPFINVVLSCVEGHVQDNYTKNNDLSYVPNSDELWHQDEQPTTKLEQREEPYVIAEIDDELAEIQFSKEEIDQMKSCMPEVSLFIVKETELEINVRTTNLSGFQMEYLGFNESAASNECALPNVVEAEEPLDLSFDKNAQVIGVQLQDNSDLLGCANIAETSLELITTQDDMLMAHKSISTDNTNLLIECNKMQCCQSMEGHRLPPFSKIFKNPANTLRANNGFLAQSTPKQKHANTSNNKTEHPLKYSAQTGLDQKNPKGANELAQNPEDVENITPSPISSDIRNCPQRKCKILKRFGNSNEKENKPKKKKTDILITKEDVEAKNSAEKSEIQILSVDIIVPGGNTLTKNSASIKPKTEEYRSVEKLVTRTEKCETIACSDKFQYAADSTSEHPTTSFSEINYTPEDTLNQLKLEADKHLFDSIMQNSLNATAPLNCNINQSSLIDGNSLLDESIVSTASEAEKENYVLLRSIGLKIIADANAEDGLKLEHLQTMRAKASDFAKIYIDFKYLWKVGSGIKSYEELELDFNKLMHRINEKFELELTIAHTKRIINLISLWHMQTYHKWLIDKKPAVDPISHYLHLFMYLPKTARRIFYCEECPRYFLAQQKYLSHREKHMAITPSCPYCQTTFDSRGTQLLHTTVCSTFKCIECDHKFENAASLEYHVRSKHLLQCKKCGKLCSTAADLDWHEHQFPIVCGLCNRLFDTPTDLQKHRQDSFHWDYTCRTCEVFLPTATQMKQHLSVCSGN